MTHRDIKALLEEPYDREQWKKLVTTIFPGRDVFARPVEHTATTVAGNKQVQHILQFGDVQLNDGNVVGLFEVSIANGVDLTSNRVAIRKAIEQPVKQSGNSGALIAFVDAEHGIWRFSFYSNTLKEDGSWDPNNPKRYTYLLGEGEKCLTAARQFETLAKKTEPVTLKDLLEAFSVEKVSKAFFREYKEHYQDFVQHLTGKRMVKKAGKWEEKTMHPPSPKLATFFNGNEKDARDFCKKLMGRLVFLYFLQKKRWLGASNAAYDDGDADFIYHLFPTMGGDTFYPVVLTGLFFNTLNAQRRNDEYTMPDGTTRKVPFLNGGLFDMDVLDRKTQLLTFPPELFSNPAEADKEKDRGFLDFLNAYNFTVHEAGPEEQTLAVDPEMLGHIFENLLEDNKDKGAFYTPKEIVHYMCQESLTQYLKNYLVREVKGAKEDPALETHLRTFLKDGTGAPLSAYSGLLLKALYEVKVCDPAIGSGAFPMGILHEVFQAVYHLQEFSPDEFSSIWGLEQWEPAEVKLRIIQHSIYGVDIERGAVDIARLRFWLSIIVDERAPRTLPNLDYKIVVGDSLLGRFNGEVLEIDWSLRATTNRTKEICDLIDSLHTKTELFFRDQTQAKKEKLAGEIRVLKVELLSKQLELNRDKFKARMLSTERIGDLTKKEMVRAAEEKIELAAFEETLGKLRALSKQKDKPLDYFDWQLDFPEVLNSNVAEDAGFDIVIGNPPYVDIKGLSPELVKHLFHFYETGKNRINLYAFFIEASKDLMRSTGTLAFVIPNSLLVNESYTLLRKEVLDSVHTIVKLPDGIFDAVVETMLLFLVRGRALEVARGSHFLSGDTVDFNKLQLHDFAKAQWASDCECRFNIFSSSDASDVCMAIAKNSKPLSDYLEFTLGITPYDKYKGHSEALIEGREFHAPTKVNKTYVPLIDGSNVQRYVVSDTVKEWLRYGPWLGAPREERFFTQPRIVVRQIVSGNPGRIYAGYTEEALYHTQIGFSLLRRKGCQESMYFFLALLNSRLMTFYHAETFLDPEKHTFQKILIANCKKFPVRKPTLELSRKLNSLVRERIDANGTGKATALEREIDVLVYKLYGLSWEQAKVVDPELGLSQAEYDAIALPEREEPGNSMVSEPGVMGLTDEGTLFGQPAEAPPAKRGPSRPPKAAPTNGQASVAILAFLKANTGWHGKSAVLKGSGVDAGEWNAAIKELVEAGKVEREGEKKGARYSLAPNT